MDLQDAHVLITGGSRGIGAAMAHKFSDAGATISVAARSTEDLQSVAASVGGTAFTVDLSDPAQTDDLVARVEEEVGPVDVLMNNAGIETSDFFADISPETIRQVAQVNLEAPMILTRQVLPGMIERERGHLGFTSSLAGTGGFPGLAVYGATKAGLSNFVAALRIELRDTSINTTVVAPGPVDTSMWDTLTDSDSLTEILKRLRILQLLPKKSPDHLAKRAVDAVQADRRHVRTPRRLTANHWLREAPTRLTELALSGVNVGPSNSKLNQKTE